MYTVTRLEAQAQHTLRYRRITSCFVESPFIIIYIYIYIYVCMYMYVCMCVLN